MFYFDLPLKNSKCSKRLIEVTTIKYRTLLWLFKARIIALTVQPPTYEIHNRVDISHTIDTNGFRYANTWKCVLIQVSLYRVLLLINLCAKIFYRCLRQSLNYFLHDFNKVFIRQSLALNELKSRNAFRQNLISKNNRHAVITLSKFEHT